MGRFDFSGEYAIRPIEGSGKLLAAIDFLDTETGLIYRDFRLFDSVNGRFMKSEQRLHEKNGEVRRIPYVQAAKENQTGRDWFDALSVEASDAYDAYVGVKAPVRSGRRRDR